MRDTKVSVEGVSVPYWRLCFAHCCPCGVYKAVMNRVKVEWAYTKLEGHVRVETECKGCQGTNVECDIADLHSSSRPIVTPQRGIRAGLHPQSSCTAV